MTYTDAIALAEADTMVAFRFMWQLAEDEQMSDACTTKSQCWGLVTRWSASRRCWWTSTAG